MKRHRNVYNATSIMGTSHAYRDKCLRIPSRQTCDAGIPEIQVSSFKKT